MCSPRVAKFRGALHSAHPARAWRLSRTDGWLVVQKMSHGAVVAASLSVLWKIEKSDVWERVTCGRE